MIIPENMYLRRYAIHACMYQFCCRHAMYVCMHAWINTRLIYTHTQLCIHASIQSHVYIYVFPTVITVYYFCFVTHVFHFHSLILSTHRIHGSISPHNTHHSRNPIILNRRTEWRYCYVYICATKAEASSIIDGAMCIILVSCDVYTRSLSTSFQSESVFNSEMVVCHSSVHWRRCHKIFSARGWRNRLFVLNRQPEVSVLSAGSARQRWRVGER